MATFTLDKLRDIVDAKYAPTIIESGDDKFELPTLLRLPEKKRNKIFDLIAEVEKGVEDEDTNALDRQLDVFREMITTAEANDRGEALLELLEDPAMIIELATTWMESSEVGE